MKSIAEVQPRDGYRLWIRFEDGVEGEIDLNHLAGQGVFSVWRDRRRFEDVRIGEFGEVSWGGDVDLCPDSLYLRLTGHEAALVNPLGGRLDPFCADAATLGYGPTVKR